jgi:hypothetical protein
MGLGMLLYVFGPTGLRSLSRYFPPFFRGHGHQSPFPADLPALAAHSRHDTGYFRRGNRALWGVGSGGAAYHLESCLVYVPAHSLWHRDSMPRPGTEKKACGFQSSPLPGNPSRDLESCSAGVAPAVVGASRPTAEGKMPWDSGATKIYPVLCSPAAMPLIVAPRA